MKFHHAGALALVGWYLMSPPPQNVSSDGAQSVNLIDSKTPLRKWRRVPESQEFECKIDCQRAISNGCHQKIDPTDIVYRRPAMLLPYADCIATDDPRLKEK